MKKSNVLVPLFLLAVVFLVFLIRRWNEPRRKEIFNRHPAQLVYSKYALCRMDCDRIQPNEVKEIMEKGIINLDLSNMQNKLCPAIALQGQTSARKSIRVVFTQCAAETNVIDCYPLKGDSNCLCPREQKQKER